MPRVSTERENPVVQDGGKQMGVDAHMFFYDSSMKITKKEARYFCSIMAFPPSVWKIEARPSNLLTLLYAWK